MAVCKYCKGQVWMVNEPDDMSASKVNNNLRMAAYSHPYLIMTSTEEMMKGPRPVIQAIPITSKVINVYPEDTTFRNLKDELNKIQGNQLTSIDVRMIGEYMFTLSNDIVEEIEAKLIKTLGFEHVISEEAEKLLEKKRTELEEKYRKMEEELREKYEKLYPQPQESQDTSEKKEDLAASVPPVTYKKRRRRKNVSVTEMKQFLEDDEKLTTDQMVDKYKFQSLSTYYTARSRYRKRLQDIDKTPPFVGNGKIKPIIK